MSARGGGTNAIRKWIGVILKWAVASAMAPLVWTMARGLALMLSGDAPALSPRLAAFLQGAGLYLLVHIPFWKPKPIYLLGHRMLQKLFVMILGGHVSTIPQGATGQGSEVAAKPAAGGSKEQLLAAVSPALIPIYTLLLTLGLGIWRSSGQVSLNDHWVALGVGASTAFHLLMAIETIQETREQQTVEGYVLTLEFIALAAVVVTVLCLAFLLPDLSVGQCFQQAFHETLAIYTAVLHQLFF